MNILKPILTVVCIVFMCAVIFYVVNESLWDGTNTDRVSTPNGDRERTEPIHGEIDVERYRTEPVSTTPPEEGYREGFAYDYYKAVEDQDWSTTYSLLSEEDQSIFSEEEWTFAQEVRVAQEGDPPPLSSADLAVFEEGDADDVYDAEVYLYYSDVTDDTIPIQVVEEMTGTDVAEYRRYLSNAEVEYLNGLLGYETGGEDDYSASENTTPEVTDYGGDVVSEDDPLYDYRRMQNEAERRMQGDFDRSTENTPEGYPENPEGVYNPGYDYDCPNGRPDRLNTYEQEIEARGNGYFCKGYTEDWGTLFMQDPVENSID